MRVGQWDGVRNYQARNILRDDVQIGDTVFIYHSSAGAETGIVGIGEVVRPGYSDPTQFDATHSGYDPISDAQSPRWFCVDVAHKVTFQSSLTLTELRTIAACKDSALLRPGNRLSIIPLSLKAGEAIIARAKKHTLM
jgi:predicted RNA-binding protein with PUA-like domain